MASDHLIRRLTDADFAATFAVTDAAFNSDWPTEALMEFERPLFEADRGLGAFDGEQMIGTTLACTFQMTVPGGGTAGTAGVTGVSVLPTHRRRGILSALMARQLTDIAGRGDPVAALFSSEAGIYGRFGYGMATEHRRFVIRRGEGGLSGLAHRGDCGAGTQAGGRTADGLRLRLAEPGAAVKDMAAVYDAVRQGRPGMMSRSGQWWDAVVADPKFMRAGAGPQRCVMAEDPAGVRGYALYSAVPEWDDDSLAAHVLRIRELFASDLAAYTALWADLLSRDLLGEVRARLRPADDPLQFLLTDRRRARSYVTDGLWIRLVDVPTALALRRYACPVDVVLEVSDQLLPANAGRWRLRAGDPADPAPPSCEHSAADADIALPVSALGAAFLGGTRVASLAAAGLVTELRPGSVGTLSAALSWDPAPWCPSMF